MLTRIPPNLLSVKNSLQPPRLAPTEGKWWAKKNSLYTVSKKIPLYTTRVTSCQVLFAPHSAGLTTEFLTKWDCLSRYRTCYSAIASVRLPKGDCSGLHLPAFAKKNTLRYLELASLTFLTGLDISQIMGSDPVSVERTPRQSRGLGLFPK